MNDWLTKYSLQTPKYDLLYEPGIISNHVNTERSECLLSTILYAAVMTPDAGDAEMSKTLSQNSQSSETHSFSPFIH